MNQCTHKEHHHHKRYSFISYKIFFSVIQLLSDILIYQISLFLVPSSLIPAARIFLTGTMTACMAFMQLYGFKNLIMLEETEHVLKSATLMLIIGALYVLFGGAGVTFGGIFFAVIAFIPLTLAIRYYLRSSLFRRGLLVRTVLVVGTGGNGKIFVHNANSSPFTLKRVVGFLDDDLMKQGITIEGFPVLGGIEDFARIQEEVRADEIMISDSSVPSEKIAELAEKYAVDVHSLDEPEKFPSRELMKSVNIFAKTVIDYTGALFALMIFSPVMLWAAYRIKKEDGGDIFFKHPRVGKNLVQFNVCKFRTMVPNAADMLTDILSNNEDLRVQFEHNFKLKDDPRITKIGHDLRKWSLDELPQLFNVLRGEMSLVGPRPIVHAEVNDYYGYELSKRIFSVKPGMTGLWQVSGRNDVNDYDTRINYDMDYINNWSIWLDIVILLKTPIAVFSKKGAY